MRILFWSSAISFFSSDCTELCWLVWHLSNSSMPCEHIRWLVECCFVYALSTTWTPTPSSIPCIHARTHTHTRARARTHASPPHTHTHTHTLFRRYAVYKCVLLCRYYSAHTNVLICLHPVYKHVLRPYYLVHTYVLLRPYPVYIYVLLCPFYSARTNVLSYVYTLCTNTYSIVYTTLHRLWHVLNRQYPAQIMIRTQLSVPCTQVKIRTQSSIPCILIQHTATQGMTLPCTWSRQLKYLLLGEDCDLIKVSRLSV